MIVQLFRYFFVDFKKNIFIINFTLDIIIVSMNETLLIQYEKKIVPLYLFKNQNVMLATLAMTNWFISDKYV